MQAPDARKKKTGKPAAGEVVVEFYGIPRRRAGLAEVRVQAATVGEALRAARTACGGGLDRLIDPDGRADRHVLVSIDGRTMAPEPETPLDPGTRLLLLSADLGG